MIARGHGESETPMGMSRLGTSHIVDPLNRADLCDDDIQENPTRPFPAFSE